MNHEGSYGDYSSNYAFGYKKTSLSAEYCFGNTLTEFRNVIKERLKDGSLKDLGIKIIEIEGLNRDDLQKYIDRATDKLTDDGLHPNVAGYEKIGLELAELIK